MATTTNTPRIIDTDGNMLSLDDTLNRLEKELARRLNNELEDLLNLQLREAESLLQQLVQRYSGELQKEIVRLSETLSASAENLLQNSANAPGGFGVSPTPFYPGSGQQK